MTTDLIADDNSIQIVVFYQYMGMFSIKKWKAFFKKNSEWLIQKLFLGHDAENKNIGWKVDYGPESVEGATEVNVNNAAGTDYALVFLNQYFLRERLLW